MLVRLALVGLLVAGCATEDEVVPGTPDAGGTETAFTLVQAKFAGQVLAAGIVETAQRFGPVTTAASANADCAALSGDTSDADGDSIPVSAKLTFDCSAERFGYSGALTGTEAVSDDQPGAVAWAFTATADLHSELAGRFGGTMVVDGDGSIIASQDSAVGPYQLAAMLDVVTLVTNVRGIENDMVEAIDWIVSYEPDVEWTAGGPVVVGTLLVDGSWDVSIKDVSAAATLSTPTALTFSPSCETRITAGLVEASFTIAGQQGWIRVEWSGCNDYMVDYQLGQ